MALGLLWSSARPFFSGTTTARSLSRIAASRCGSPMGWSTRASARDLRVGVTSVPNAQTARRRKPRIGRKPSVLPCASATAPRQSTFSAQSEGRTRNFRPSTHDQRARCRAALRSAGTAGESPGARPRRSRRRRGVFGELPVDEGDSHEQDGKVADAGYAPTRRTRRLPPAAFGARGAALDARRRSKTRPARTPDVSGGGTWKSRAVGSPTFLPRSASLSRRGTISPRGDRP